MRLELERMPVWVCFVGVCLFAFLVNLAVALTLTGCATSSAEPTLAAPHVMVFHAKWCKYCPTDDEITRLILDFPDVNIMTVDVDRDRELVEKYRVKRVPQFIVCDAQGCRMTRNFEELRGWLAAGR